MAVILFLICASLWYLPIYFKQGKKNKLPVWRYIIALVLGMTLGFFGAIIIQFAAEYGMTKVPISSNIKIFILYYLIVAISEEGLKFLCGRIALGKAEKVRKIDSILIFGAAGSGFEIVESILSFSNPTGAIVRGILVLHIIWQLWMGAYWWEAAQCKLNGDRKGTVRNRILALCVPLFLHGTHDTLCEFSGAYMMTDDESKMVFGFCLLIVAFAIGITFAVITIKRSLRCAKESRLAEETVTE